MAQSGPLYRRIAGELREAIGTGALRPGDRLPTEQELGDRYGVSRNTVRLALAMLANEGAITSTPGRGTFVRERAVTTYHATWAERRERASSDHSDAYRAEVIAQGQTPEYREFEMRIVSASDDLAERLGVDVGDSLVSRAFLRLVNGEPASWQASYYPMDIAQECGLLTPHDIPRGTIRVMAEHGHVEVGYVDEITTRMPSPSEAANLALGAGTPTLVYIRVAYTKQRPVRLTTTVFAGDRNRVVYELGDLDALHEDSEYVIIELATLDDLATIVAMRAEASQWLRERGVRQWDRPWPTHEAMVARTAARIQAGETWMARDRQGGIAAGTVALDTFADPNLWTSAERQEPAMYLHRLIVRRGWQGLGARILDWACARAESLGNRWVRVDVWTHNEALHRYYLGHGFRHVRTIDVADYPAGALFQRQALRPDDQALTDGLI